MLLIRNSFNLPMVIRLCVLNTRAFSLLLVLIFTSLSFFSLSSTKDEKEQQKVREQELLNEKVDFILKVANNVSVTTTDNDSKEFIIAVYGKDSESKALYRSLKTKTVGRSIKNKPIDVKLFKRMSAVKEADLIYVNGNSKVSLAELQDKVGREYVLVTEDFPYGQSMINFVADEQNGLSYAIQEESLLKQGVTIGSGLLKSKARVVGKNSWIKRLADAQSIIQKQEQTIGVQEGEISEQSKTIEDKSNTIEIQESTISEKSEKIAQSKRIIQYQKTIITGGIIGGIIILGLVFFLVRINQKRKIALLESEAKTKEILSSINYAERIQRASLPSISLLKEHLQDGFIFYQPKDIVSGDFYWLEEKEDATYFAVADCTGHGVPGAMLSVLCSNSLSRAINELGMTEPSKILDQTVVLLEGFFSKSGDRVQDGMDIALCKLEKNKRQLQYAGANRPLYFFKNGVFNEIKADRQPIGSYDYRKGFTNHVVELEKGDSLYLFSDGIVDQFGGEKSKKFSSRRLKTLLETIKNESMDDQKKLLTEEFQAWQGENESIDDACVLGVRFT